MAVHERYREFMSDQREFFDALISEDWESYNSKEWDETRRYEVARLFDRIQPSAILDIGCGCGFHDQVMAQYPFVKRVVGIDYSAKSIEAANLHYPHAKIERRVADLTDLINSDENSYDLVVSWQVFEHLDTPQLYFSNAMKVLKSGGWLVIFTPNRLRLSNVKRLMKGQPVEYCDPQHFYEYVPKEIRKLSLSHNLKFIDSFGYGLSGLKLIDQMANKKRLQWGNRLPIIANLFCIIFKKP